MGDGAADSLGPDLTLYHKQKKTPVQILALATPGSELDSLQRAADTLGTSLTQVTPTMQTSGSLPAIRIFPTRPMGPRNDGAIWATGSCPVSRHCACSGSGPVGWQGVRHEPAQVGNFWHAGGFRGGGLSLFRSLPASRFMVDPDQRGDRLFRENQFTEAAKMYRDPEREAAAYYRAGKFKEAAAAYARVGSAAALMEGNSLVMLGKYADAVQSYDRARPSARLVRSLGNRTIAVVRRDRLLTKGGQEGSAEEKADKIVLEKNNHSAGEEVQIAGGEPLSDDQLRGLWLRRVQTKPADFLRSKLPFKNRPRKKANDGLFNSAACPGDRAGFT